MEKLKSATSCLIASIGWGISLQDAKDIAQLVLLAISIVSATLMLAWGIQDRAKKAKEEKKTP